MATVYRSVALIVGASILSMGGARAAEEAAKPEEPAELAEVVVSVERVACTSAYLRLPLQPNTFSY